MTATADTSTTDPVEDEAVTTEPSPEPSETAETATKPNVKPHTNVPPALAGPARRTALALGVPSLGLAELLVHANLGWAGVAAFTGAAVVGAGAVYAVRRQQGKSKNAGANSKVGASKTPSSLATRLRAKPIGRAPAGAGSASSRGTGARGGLAGRMMKRLSGRRGAGGTGFGRGGGAGGHPRGVAGSFGSRAGLGSTGHANKRGGRSIKPSSPGAHAAAAKSAQLTGGRPSKTSAGLRRLASTSPRGKTNRSGVGVGLRGRPSSRGRAHSSTSARGQRARGGNRPHGTPRRGRAWGGGFGLPWARTRHAPTRRPRARRLGSAVARLCRYALVPLSVPAVLGGVVFAGTALTVAGLAVAGTYGAFRLATSTPVRYGASMIAGWVRLGVSRAYQWARAQWWKSRGKTTAADLYIAEGEPVDEPYVPPSTRPDDIHDAVIVDDPEPTPSPPAPVLAGHRPATPSPARALPAAAPRAQPRLKPEAPAPTTPTHEKELISVTMQNVIETITSHDTFVPNDGPDTQAHLRGYPQTLHAIARKFDADLASIVAKLPQMEESLQGLAGMGQALDAFATQLDEAFELWRQSASWVWQNQES